MTDNRVALKAKHKRLQRRRKHVHKRIVGLTERPRLVVFRSNRHIYAQLVDDQTKRTITGCSTLTEAIREKMSTVKVKTEQAKIVGVQLAELAKQKGISTVAFDRNGRKYQGRVKALADGARTGGLKF
ncbi:MAG: 50S ribosomal protein L18 [Candidatus Hatepunaea meridiana]|nr:50S ribosomal protein L18 [Candidatus Hatepunaea meridiana]